ncbi:uncharacterized protein LOC114480071 [Gouania willdenowi]|uniref:uncharacterized protein LOC114480071 n=1 Tax=Gouania willdenowi TaxID=441366 RepID=UPI0010553CDA|nr:uncharacterized protein LOC114480071 [Gouania willdenowi]XP_028329673.1 uncharacterized protein LOC114480071 [Gouania willdenowi]
MTIGRNSRKSSVRSSIRAPKFLDKSSGFYGRLDEPECAREDGRKNGGESVDNKENVTNASSTVANNSKAEEREEVEMFVFNEGMMEDDGETLLHRKPSRLSSRWRRSSRRKQKEEEDGVMVKIQVETVKSLGDECEKVQQVGKEPQVVHFHVREEEDDQVLIRDKKRVRDEEGEEERRATREQEEGMKMAKRKNYKKAFRRGWEAFITNLYSVTLTPFTSSTPSSSSPSSPSSKKKLEHSAVLAEFR